MKSSEKAFEQIVTEEVSKYRRWHNAIIEKARTRIIEGYCEGHHVRPRALGGSNEKSNIVALTYREHFIVHWLLTKFTTGNDQKKMLHAMSMMAQRRQGRAVSSWQYDAARRAFREARSNFKHTEETKRKMGKAQSKRHYSWHHTADIWMMLFVPRIKKAHGNRGRKFTPEHKRKIGDAHIGRIVSEETKLKLSMINGGRRHSEESKQRMSSVKIGKRHTEEHKRRIGEANQGRICSEETRNKIGVANKGRRDTDETSRKKSEAQKGRKHSAETKSKMRLAAFRRWRQEPGVSP